MTVKTLFPLWIALFLLATITKLLQAIPTKNEQPESRSIAEDTSTNNQKLSVPLNINELIARGAQEATNSQQPPMQDDSTISSQVAQASDELRSINVEERIGATEQLAAYPTKESERLLTDSLRLDKESSVRESAATSLGRFRAPNRETISALFQALEDETEEVQQAAFASIGKFITRMDADSTNRKKLITELRKKASSKRVTKTTREDIRSFIADQ